MKRHNLYTIASLFIGMLASCQSKTEDVMTRVNEGPVLNIGISPVSRTSTDVDYKTVFSDKDLIGMYGTYRESGELLHDNLCYNYDGTSGRWSADRSITFPLDGQELNFYSYYPYTEAANGKLKFDFTVEQNQSIAGAYDKSDLLLASNTTVTNDTEIVTLRFKHKLSMVEFEIKLPEGEEVKTVEVKAKRTAEVDLISQTVTLKETGEEAEFILCSAVGDGKYRACVPAQSLSGKIIRIITKSNRVYWYKSGMPLQLIAETVTPVAVDCTK